MKSSTCWGVEAWARSYKARQKSLNREVAIKVLPPMAAEDDGSMHFAERFKAEAQAMARLNHPGIVAVHDAGETPGGLLYFVMEMVQGTDVSRMIASSGRLPPEHAYAITAHVCDALAYAHGNGLIHRDIKPANIMVDTQGRVKVADFGLAKAVDAQTGFTQSNMAVGTPDFVAPEALIPGMPVDGRADLYAVGVMLYQMLTGQVPRGAFKPASVWCRGSTAALMTSCSRRCRPIVKSVITAPRNCGSISTRCSCPQCPRRTCSGIAARRCRSRPRRRRSVKRVFQLVLLLQAASPRRRMKRTGMSALRPKRRCSSASALLRPSALVRS